MRSKWVIFALAIGAGCGAEGTDTSADTGASGVDTSTPAGTATDTVTDTSGCATYYLDDDGDGYGTPDQSEQLCEDTSGYVNNSDDCDDSVFEVNPGVAEICDGQDTNCDGLADDADPTVDLSTGTDFFSDGDVDGYGAGAAVVACAASGDLVEQSGDCDDADDAVHPGATEVCDGQDDDCDGGVDGTASAPNQCGAFLGDYGGDYTISAEEKVGSSVVNTMSCATGDALFTIDLATTPVIQGILSCSYSGGLTGFLPTQEADFEGTLMPSGDFTGVLTHRFQNGVMGIKSFSVSGTVSGGSFVVQGIGGWKPNNLGGVPWEVNYKSTLFSLFD